MLLSELDIVFQMLEVYAELCLSIDSIPPTSRESATRATDSRSASSISWAPFLLLPLRGDITKGGAAAI